MKLMQKWLALLLCALMIGTLAGCLEKEEGPAEAAMPQVTEVPGDIQAPQIDPDLPAFTLGDITVTVGEIQTGYDTVLNYLGQMGITPTSAEDISQYRSMVIDGLLNEKMMEWKAREMGIALTDQDRAEIEQEVEELVAEYAAEYIEEARSELGETADETAVTARAREMLREDVENYFGYSFEDWLKEMSTSYEASKLADQVQKKFNETVTVTEEDARNWFDSELADQKESFEAGYAAFKSQEESYRLGETDVPPLYTPEGFIQVQVVTFDMDPNDSAAFAANEVEMTNLEAEYGKLVLQGQDEDRQKQIEDRYAALTAENDSLTAADREKAQRARADAVQGMDFTTLFATYSNEEGSMGYFGYDEDNPRRTGVLSLYTKEQDTDYLQQVWETAVALQDGEVSEPLQAGDSIYLIKRLGALPAGEAAFADNAETYTAAALAARQQEEWDAVQEDWLHEARNAATFYEENYAGIGAR